MIIGTEKDILDLKKRGKPGDFLIYPKDDDRSHPMRIAFLKTGGRQSVVQKLKVKQSVEGFSFQASNPKWFPSMSDLALNSTDENSKRLISPFLGYATPPVSPSDEGAAGEGDEDDNTYVLDEPVKNNTPLKLPAKKPPIKLPPPRKLPTLPRNEPPPIRTPKTPTPQGTESESPESSETESTTGEPTKDSWEPEDNSDPGPQSIDILGNNAPTDLDIRYNLDKKEIARLLKNQPDGTFVIHQSEIRGNNISKPYTIYANKTSPKDGQIKLAPAYILYDDTTEQFSVGKGKKYPSLKDLLAGNKKLLKTQLKT